MPTILDIPEELLLQIMESVVAETHAGCLQMLRNNEAIGSSEAYSWLSFTHVCRSWHFLALNSSSLWTNVVIIHEKVTKEVVRRSGERALSVIFQFAGPHRRVQERLTAFAWLLETQVHRLASVAMPALPQLWTPALAARATELSSLEMSLAYPKYYYAETLLAMPPPLSFPALRQFVYRDSPSFPLGTQLLCNTLKKLVFLPRPIGYTSWQVEGCITAATLARALARMPHLEELYMRVEDMDVQGNEEGSPELEVHLPCLRTLRLNGSATAIATLFKQLRLPRTVMLEFECGDSGPHVFDGPLPVEQTLVSFQVYEHTTNPDQYPTDESLEPTVALAITISNSLYSIRGWRSTFTTSDFATRQPDITLYCQEWVLGEGIDTLLSVFQFRIAQRLHVSRLSAEAVEAETLPIVKTLCNAPSISTLHFDGIVACAVSDYISGSPARGVHLQDVIFRPSNEANAAIWTWNWLRDTTRDENVVALAQLSSFERFISACVDPNRPNGRPVEGVVLQNVRNVCLEDVEALRAAGVQVVWDGHEIVDTSTPFENE